jgi:hypothetical protein
LNARPTTVPVALSLTSTSDRMNGADGTDCNRPIAALSAAASSALSILSMGLPIQIASWLMPGQ